MRAGSLPPASAKSGRPPPLPPTTGAICFDYLSGVDARGEILGHRHDERQLSISFGADDHDAGLDAVAMRISQLPQLVLSKPFGLLRDEPAGRKLRLLDCAR